MPTTQTPDPSGKSWTDVEEIANAIDRSHACGGGMVMLTTTDADVFEEWLTELSGMYEEEKEINDRVYEFTNSGDYDDPSDPSPAWAVQLTLVPA